jgi:predicted ATPase
MLIALTGVHSSGKTSVLDALKNKPKLAGFTFVGEITREIKEAGFEINEEGTNLTQLFILARHLENLLLDNAIIDRCLLDGLVYTDYLFFKDKVMKEVYAYALKAFKSFYHKYDYIFFFPPTLPLYDDAVRSTDTNFYRGIAHRFSFYITQFQIPVIHIIQGTIEERVKQILGVIR